MTNVLDPNTIVSQIDLEDVWFLADSDAKVALPGSLRADVEGNTVSRRQLRSIFMGLVASGLGDLPEAQALDAYRKAAGMSPKQWDIQLVNHAISKMRSETADLPLTGPQLDLINTNIAALQGTEPHRDVKVAKAMAALSPQRRDMLTDMLINASVENTRGALDRTMSTLKAFVGDPAVNAAMARRSAAEQVEGDLDEVTPEINGEEAF